TGIAFLWFYTLISEIGPARASVIAYIAPGFSVVYGVVLLDEAFSVGAVAGLGLILAGSWLAVGGRAERSARDPAPVPVQEACAAAEVPAPVAAAPAPVES
ncbi:MAG TPA: EamA family transporter, partial [Solirubrobacteraceae bacterium]